MRITTLTLALAVTGCAVPTTGVVPRGDDLMTVTRQGSGAWVSTETLKAEASKEGADHCQAAGKKFRFVHSKEIQAGPLGRWPESEVLFKCE